MNWLAIYVIVSIIAGVVKTIDLNTFKGHCISTDDYGCEMDDLMVVFGKMLIVFTFLSLFWPLVIIWELLDIISLAKTFSLSHKQK